MLDETDVLSLVARIECEYREMPGLQLTEPQMQRMWCLDGATCQVVITVLVYARDRREDASQCATRELTDGTTRRPHDAFVSRAYRRRWPQKMNVPRLVDVTMSTMPSLLRSAAVMWEPTPDLLWINSGTNSAPPGARELRTVRNT